MDATNDLYVASSKQNPDLDYTDLGYGLKMSPAPQHIDFALKFSINDFYNGGDVNSAQGSYAGFVIYTSAGFAEGSVVNHPYINNYCTKNGVNEVKTVVCRVENVPQEAFGKRLTRFKYAWFDPASTTNTKNFWKDTTLRNFGFFGVLMPKTSSLYVEDNMADFYIETYGQGLTTDGINSAYLVKTALVNTFTVSLKTGLYDFEK